MNISYDSIHQKFLSYWELLARNTIVANLGMGMAKPDFLSEKLIAKSYFEKGHIYRPGYQHQAGKPSLRALLAKFQSEQTELVYSSDHIMLSAGALGGFSLVIDSLACLLKSFKFIEILPTFPSLSGKIRLIAEQYQAEIVTVAPADSKDFVLKENEIVPHISENTIIYLTNPNNPTGKYIKPHVMQEIVNACEKTNSYLVIDECCDISFDTSYHWAKSSHVIRIQSFSKQYLLAGYRIGYLIASTEWIDLFSSRFSFAGGNAPVVANDAIEYFINEKSILPQIREVSKECVKKAIMQLESFPYVDHIIHPEACYYLFIKLKHTQGSWELFEHLVKKGIDVVPGTLFGISENESWIRLCCARPSDELLQSLDILKNALVESAFEPISVNEKS